MVVQNGYKQTDIGVIPEDWDKVKLEELTDIKTGPFGSALHAEDYVSSGTPIITVEHLGESTITQKNLPYVSEKDRRRLIQYSLQARDIVFSRVGSVDRNAYVTAHESGWLFSGRLLRLRAISSTVSTKYLGYYFKYEPTKARIRGAAVGQTMASLNTKIMKGFYVTLPPLPEQCAIAEAISDVDELISSLEKLIKKRNNIKIGAMQELLSGKTRLLGYNDKWVEKPLGELFDFNGGLSASREQLSTSGICYLHYGDIHGAIKPYVDTKVDYLRIPKLNIPSDSVSSSVLLNNGDVVFVDASEDDEGASRHVVIRNIENITFIAGLHTITAKEKETVLDNLFKEYCFQAKLIKDQFRYYSVGTKVVGINKNNLSKVLLKYPKQKAEQTAIATTLSDMDNEIDALTQKLNKYRLIKQGMMQELLTGKIRLV